MALKADAGAAVERRAGARQSACGTPRLFRTALAVMAKFVPAVRIFASCTKAVDAPARRPGMTTQRAVRQYDRDMLCGLVVDRTIAEKRDARKSPGRSGSGGWGFVPGMGPLLAKLILVTVTIMCGTR
jgi:hypothetical protein